MKCSECGADRKRLDLISQLTLAAFMILAGFMAWHVKNYAAPLIEEIEELKIEKATLTAVVQKEMCK